jgi:hypothetical protein
MLKNKLDRCGTCKHWNRFTDESDVRLHGAHVGTCSSNRFVYEEKTPDDGLTYWDYEGYAAGFQTGQSFGCVHWAKV